MELLGNAKGNAAIFTRDYKALKTSTRETIGKANLFQNKTGEWEKMHIRGETHTYSALSIWLRAKAMAMMNKRIG